MCNDTQVPRQTTLGTTAPGSTTLRLVVLAAAAFAYVTAETLPVGLLPEISADMSVSESSVGLLLTFYAYGVAAMTMPLMTFVHRWPRRRVVVVTVAALAISQLISAVAVGYPMLVVARMICAATHGVFWAVVAPVAASRGAGKTRQQSRRSMRERRWRWSQAIRCRRRWVNGLDGARPQHVSVLCRRASQ